MAIPSASARIRRRAALAVLILAGAGAAGWLLLRPGAPGGQAIAVLDPARVLVVRTPGGMLEVVTLRKPETFAWQVGYTCPLIDCTELFGKTTSEIAVQAAYTYRIPLEEEWQLRLEQGRYVLRVPPLQPALPVAFETGTMRIRTEKGGWFSPAAGPNREAVVRHLGGELARRSTGPEYLRLAEPAAAATVQEFARRWLARQQLELRHPLEVRFDAPMPRAEARGRAQ